MLLPLVTPELVFAVGLFLLFTSAFGFIGLGTTAQVIGQVTFSLSWVVLIVRGRLVMIGNDVEEAAADLGAPPWDRLRRVLLPLLAPAIAASVLTVFALSHRRLRGHAVHGLGRGHDDRADADLLDRARGADAGAERAGHDHARPVAARAGARVVRVPAAVARAGDEAGHVRGGGQVSRGQIDLENLVKRYGDVLAVDDVDLHMPGGEFFTLLGPSGCGKTSTLRLIAGFEKLDSGSIQLDGVEMSAKPPHKRPVNTVFQSYALFPHMTVAENVAFGLRYQRCTKAEQARRVGEAMEMVQLGGLEARRPGQLSGGQQQRVALARAIVLEPPVLLLDEPLGALDARLRVDLQVELKRIQETLGITFVYVTHDQDEALTMSDRVAVMRGGKVQQCDEPRVLYEEPATAFVANFLGSSNLIPARGRERRADRRRVHGCAPT